MRAIFKTAFVVLALTGASLGSAGAAQARDYGGNGYESGYDRNDGDYGRHHRDSCNRHHSWFHFWNRCGDYSHRDYRRYGHNDRDRRYAHNDRHDRDGRNDRDGRHDRHHHWDRDRDGNDWGRDGYDRDNDRDNDRGYGYDGRGY